MQPTSLVNEGRPLDELTGRNELFRPPINHDVDNCMLVNEDDEDRLIGADEFTARVPVPKRLSCLERRIQKFEYYVKETIVVFRARREIF